MSDYDEQPTVELVAPAPRAEDDRMGTLIHTPFNHEFVAAIKETWRYPTRLWNPGEEAWWVEAGYEDEVCDLVQHHYGVVRVIHEDGGEELRGADGNYEQGRLL